MDTSRVDGVEAPPHDGTPRSYGVPSPTPRPPMPALYHQPSAAGPCSAGPSRRRPWRAARRRTQLVLVPQLCGAGRFGRLALPCLAATVACPLLQPAELLRAASVTNWPLRAELFCLLVSYCTLARATANSSRIYAPAVGLFVRVSIAFRPPNYRKRFSSKSHTHRPVALPHTQTTLTVQRCSTDPLTAAPLLHRYASHIAQ